MVDHHRADPLTGPSALPAVQPRWEPRPNEEAHHRRAVLVGVGFLVKRFGPSSRTSTGRSASSPCPTTRRPSGCSATSPRSTTTPTASSNCSKPGRRPAWRGAERPLAQHNLTSIEGRSRLEGAMRVLTVYAHHEPRSFCHGVLERFTAGLADAGHTSDVVDLYAINFDPVIRSRDGASYISGNIPADILELMDPRNACSTRVAGRSSDGSRAGASAASPTPRSPRSSAAACPKTSSPNRPRSPPADDGSRSSRRSTSAASRRILKGWIDRVFTLDFAFGLTSEGWRGDVNGRIPLLHHQRALIMTSTIFDERSLRRRRPRRHRQGHRRLGLPVPRHPRRRARLLLRRDRGPARDDQPYLDQAYDLGKTFGVPRAALCRRPSSRSGIR